MPLFAQDFVLVLRRRGLDEADRTATASLRSPCRTRPGRLQFSVGRRSSLAASRPRLSGRDQELGELVEALEKASRGRGGFVVLTGDAGIGKTTLLEALQDATETTDARFVWGTCWEEGGAPAY